MRKGSDVKIELNKRLSAKVQASKRPPDLGDEMHRCIQLIKGGISMSTTREGIAGLTVHLLKTTLGNRRCCVLMEWSKVTSEIKLLMNIYFLIAEDCLKSSVYQGSSKRAINDLHTTPRSPTRSALRSPSGISITICISPHNSSF